MTKPPRGLLLLIAVFFLAVLVADFNHWSYALYILRPVTSFLILALVWLAATRGVYQMWIVLGLILALLGDICFLWSRNVTLGAVIFLGSFMMYVIAFIAGRKLRLGWFIMPYLYIIYGAVIYTFLLPGYGWYRWPALLYFMIVLTMGWLALDRFLSRQEGNIFAVYGTVLLIVSVFFYTINRFFLPFHYSHLFMLAAYFPGQLLIAFSVYAEKPSLE